MTNPFEDPTASYLVLTNRIHHSFWPAGLEPPAGWTTVLPASSREECLAFLGSQRPAPA
ncbi:MbtH family protein [Kitasatospora sp. NBC_00374]|uniref:MbtH family protein n=1 Tax=Kitasatospora sp. NBC_00374 TaxID=2975964 RepID=UPI003254B1B5